ncbi:MAG: DinB family protein [Acidimicrobiia bacterium]
MQREPFLHLLRDRRARFHGVLADLGLSIESGEDLLIQVGGEWSLGEHLVHIAAWERRFTRTVTGLPKVLPYPSHWQKFNDAVFAEWGGVQPDAARTEYALAHAGLVAAVAALPLEGDPVRPKLLVGWNLGMAPRHYREHATIVLEHAGLPKPPPWRGRIVE